MAVQKGNAIFGCQIELIYANGGTIELLTPLFLEAIKSIKSIKSMCKLASNDLATISSRRPEMPGATE